MIISEISIKNFRSISRQTISLNKFNIFVGLNDVGKSNVLKALNLFFNGRPDARYPFEFQQDYCSYAPVINKKAKEIEISLKIELPGYTDNCVKWVKTFRENGLNQKDDVLKSSGEKLSDRSRSELAVRRLKYRYIPAVKSEEIFQNLLKEMYLAMSSAENAQILKSSDKFSKEVSEYTKDLSKNIKSKLGLESGITIPKNMSDIFSKFKFDTTDNGKSIPLNMRGDGIQARHIPPLLNFISAHDMVDNNKGKIPISVIWGYEEPENGVEMLKCFDMSRELLEYSKNFQMLITTHSPSFYLIGSENADVSTFYTIKTEKGTEFQSKENLNSEMGFMPIIAPYVKEKSEEIQKLKTVLQGYGKPIVIFVEGKTDAKYLKETNRLFNIFESKNILIDTTGTSENGQSKGEGYTWIDKTHEIMLYNPDLSNGKKIVFLYDCDCKKEDSCNNNLYVKRIAVNKEETTYKRGIENLLTLASDFDRSAYYQEKINVTEYGETRKIQTLDKNKLCDALISLSDADKKVIFKNIATLLREIKEKLDGPSPRPATAVKIGTQNITLKKTPVTKQRTR
ncbi:MAG: ATP-binding protein [Lactobacillales bacterium]|jgi:hypothetical protein|nr:ATP-binding protein [Lactobacillales bacterium]